MTKLKAKCIIIPIYRRALVICKSFDEAQQYYKSIKLDFDIEKVNGYAAHIVHGDIDTNIIVIRDDRTQDEKLSTLVHEVSHTVDHMFEQIWEEPQNIGTEARAYLTQYIFEQCYSHIFKAN